MDRGEARILLPVFQAFTIGKQIQRKPIYGFGYWEDITYCYWQTDVYEYRIKPERKLVPFTIDDRRFLMGRVITLKYQKDTFYETIVGVHKNGIAAAGDFISFDILFNEWTFDDGSPCGKYVD